MLKLAFLAICLPALAYAQSEEKLEYLCSGTEPFWALVIGQDSAGLERMGDEVRAFEVATKTIASGRFWPILYSLTNVAETTQAIVNQQACSDGMSDKTYEFTVNVLTSEAGAPVLITGCCRIPTLGD